MSETILLHNTDGFRKFSVGNFFKNNIFDASGTVAGKSQTQVLKYHTFTQISGTSSFLQVLLPKSLEN